MLAYRACPDNSGKSRSAGKTLLLTLVFFLLLMQISLAQWVQVGLENKAIKDIAANGSNIFVITSDSGTVYRSVDNGNNWTVVVDTGTVDIAIAPSGTIYLIKEVHFYGVLWNRLFSSSDNGAMWDTLNVEEQITPPGWQSPMLMNVSVSRTGIVYCGISRRSGEKGKCTFIASSTDDGITWTTPGWDLLGGYMFDYKGLSVISAGFDTGLNALRSGWNDIYLSTDNGSSWTELGTAPMFVGNCHLLSLCLSGNVLLGGGTPEWGGCGIFLSTDTCNTWTQISTLIPQAGLSMESGGNLVGTDSLGVFLFSDNGDSLGSKNEGLTNLSVYTLTSDNNDYAYAGTADGIWRRPLSEIVTSIDNELSQPTYFILEQNYPNPFNPITKIKYSVPQTSQVQIKVFDVLGNEIETLVNEEKPAGRYELAWRAANLPSGVYFYHLRTGDPSTGSGRVFVETKKMLLLK